MLVIGEAILDRPQHQRERRAELMAHVAEKCRLGAIDRRERFDAAAFLFVGVRVRQSRRQLAHQQRDEAPVRVVDDPERVERRHEHSGGPLLRLLGDGHDERACRRLVPRARRKIRKPAGEIDDDTGRIGQGLTHGPRGIRRSDDDLADRCGMIRRDARAAYQSCAVAGLVEEIRQRERQIAWIRVERLSKGGEKLGLRVGASDAGGGVPEQGHPTLGNHPLGLLGDHAEQAADDATIVGDGAVGEGVVRLF